MFMISLLYNFVFAIKKNLSLDQINLEIFPKKIHNLLSQYSTHRSKRKNVLSTYLSTEYHKKVYLAEREQRRGRN